MNILEGVLYSREYTAYRVMDLFIPGHNANGSCIMFIHGGGWNSGKRSDWHDTAKYIQASPIEQIKGKEPPFLFIHGDEDDTIPVWHSVNMHEKLVEKDMTSRLIILPGVNHGFGYGVKTEAQKASVQYMTDFLLGY